MNATRTLMPLSTRRRFVMIGAVGLLLIFASLFMQSFNNAELAWRITSVIGIITMLYGWGQFVLPNHSGLTPLTDDDLDERQQAVATRTYATAYQILSSAALLTGAYFLLADTFPALPALETMTDKSILFVGLIWTVIGLPTAILAWTEPDEIE